jgi:hypothetical protein
VVGAVLAGARDRLRPWPLSFGVLAYALITTTTLRAAPWLAALTLIAALAFGSLAVSGAAGWLGLLRGAVAVWTVSVPAVA